MRIILGFLLAAVALAGGAEAQWIPRVPGNTFDYTLPAAYLPGRLVLKFAEGTAVRRLDGRWQAQGQRLGASLLPMQLDPAELSEQLQTVEGLISEHPAAGEPAPLFLADDSLLATLKSNGERATGRQLADLGLYFSVPLAAATTFGEIELLLAQLNAQPAVEVAYAEPRAQPAGFVGTSSSLTSPDFMGLQYYLDPAPTGIDIREVWRHNQGRGGHGTDVKVVDVEGAWRETHEDLPPLFYQGGTEILDIAWEHHGTAVLGEMAGVDNGLGVHGIADHADYGVQSIFPAGVAAAVLSAAVAAGEGGIVVLEVHAPGPPGASNCTCNLGQCDFIPMEYWQAEFDAIATATANCVTVVEAGGNGSADLDHAVYGNAFNRSFRDSGAILVAASLALQRVPACFTNHGSRMDFHAWGEYVVTTGYGNLYIGGSYDEAYTHVFSGTSSATPIIAGAAAAIQGAQRGYGRPPLAPEDVSAVLRHGATPQSGTAIIGPMPDLRNAVSRLPYLPRICVKRGDPYDTERPNTPE